MNGAPEPVGTLQVALGHAQELLKTKPALAIEQAIEILKAVPNQPQALLIMAAGRRACGDATAAIEILEPLAKAHPNWAAARYELGRALGSAAQGERAISELRRAVELKPDLPDAWRALGDHLIAIGDSESADGAYRQHIKASTKDPRLLEAAAALCDNRIAVAEALLREHLKRFPTDVAAIRMLAEVAARLGRNADAETLLARCLELAPSFAPARHNYATVLHRQHKATQAMAQVDHLLASEPRNPGYRILKAAICGSIGEYTKAIEIYAGFLSEYPKEAKAWMSYGHALKTAGRQAESVSAYRKSIELAPNLGEVWWSLANLKTLRFSTADLETMRGQLQRTDLSAEDRFHFHFAIGKALEDAGAYAESFEHYAQGNRLRREGVKYDPDENSAHVRRSKSLFTREFFEQRADQGADAPDPIFIVGLPRSGSTLVEQILSSHPEVEGTMELPNVPAIARALGGRKSRSDTSSYPEILATMTAEQFRALGERYLAETRIQRKTGEPFFIDKLPNNWAHVGLIHLVLPNAKIIDARRHPLGCCFSGFKQHFARGQRFTYSLEEIGRYYRDYVELMAHFDEVLPGRVHRVLYERMIDDTEAEVRQLLEYCNLPFDARCLRFYETERAVRTASSEQVRQPIFREGVDQWRHYEPWLGPLKEALGPVLASWPEPPPV